MLKLIFKNIYVRMAIVWLMDEPTSILSKACADIGVWFITAGTEILRASTSVLMYVDSFSDDALYFEEE